MLPMTPVALAGVYFLSTPVALGPNAALTCAGDGEPKA